MNRKHTHTPKPSDLHAVSFRRPGAEPLPSAPPLGGDRKRLADVCIAAGVLWVKDNIIERFRVQGIGDLTDEQVAAALRICRKCGSFDRYRDGVCKPCKRAANAVYYVENRDRELERKRLYQIENREARTAAAREQRMNRKSKDAFGQFLCVIANMQEEGLL